MEKKDSKLYTGSVCLTDLIEKAKEKHSAVSKSASNGKIYVNVLLWENSETDKYGNSHSLQLNSTKERKDVEGKVYVGNFKPVELKKQASTEVSVSDIPDDLPF
jgi:hypothetical protein